jgi:hypothetical protein
VRRAAPLLVFLAFAAHAGEIRGRVKLTDAPPARKVRQISKDANICGNRQPDESVLVAKDGGLANVVVSLAAAAEGDWPDPPPPVLDQEMCRFVPHVVVAQVGQKLDMLNSDPVFHNAHGKRSEETLFNTAFPEKVKPRSVTLEESGIIEVGCDAGHDWMRAYIHVFDHPFFAVSGKDGRFTMEVPPGRHTLKIWHEHYGTRTTPVEVGLGGADVLIEFP